MEKKITLEISVLGSIHLMKLLFRALISRKVTVVCVDAAHYDLNLWDDNKAQKLAPPAILCP